MVFLRPIRKGLFAVSLVLLLGEEEYRQRTHQREISSANPVTYVASILSLSDVTSVMLLDFNRPVSSGQLEQMFW
ncbi:MAG: hypothetical protein HOM87_09515 [Proteobacteria bacterium]|nr:hypothetical protein [Pseudomonadota bacterium]